MSEPSPAGLALLARDLDPSSAEVLRSLLEAQGIPAVLSRESGGSVFPVNFGVFGLVDVLVPRSRWDEASRIANAFRSGAETAEDPGEA